MGRQTPGYKVPERVAGFDLYNELLDLSAHKGYKAYFFGGSPGIAEAAKAKAEELYPGVKVVGCHNGYFKDEDVPQIIADINASGADMLSLLWAHRSRRNGWWHTARSLTPNSDGHRRQF